MKNYFDLQVNGYGGADFNRDDLTGELLHMACEKLESDGVAEILATIITEDIEVMCRRLGNLVKLREQDPLAKRIIAGLHIEGPFINPTKGYRGAHPKDAIIAATVESANRLLNACDGMVRIFTLAPECDAKLAVTKMLTSRGIVVSAGHCNPSLDELSAAIDAGLSMFTHLGNGCPPQLPRHDNIIQRALSLSDRLWLIFIADGTHVPMFALDNYLKTAGIDRCIIVTDAIAPAGLGPGKYTLGRWELNIGKDMVARSPDNYHLVGSAVTMPQSEINLREQLGLTDEQIRLLTVENPRKAINDRGA